MPHSPWLDGVHLLGIAAVVVALVNVIVGATIFFGLRARGVGYEEPRRRGRRHWHIAFGVTAVALALAHAVGRFLQAGNFALNKPVQDLLVLFVLILGLSGIPRALVPARHTAALTVLAWLHRLGAVGVLALALTHATQSTLFHFRHLRRA